MILPLKQKLISLAMAGLITLGCTGIAATAAFVDTTTNPTVAHADEWRYSNGGWWLQTNNGYATGWRQIGESILSPWYYFDNNGWMKTGWQWIGGKWYYLDNNGVMQTNWQSIDGKWYYFNDDGAMKTGWVTEPWWKSWYYLDSSGAMVTGWNRIGSKWYYFNKSGEMLIGWQCINGKWYHLNGSGAMDVNKWIGNYYVKSDGSMAINQWIGKYRVGANGLWDGTKTNLNPLHIEADFFEFDLPSSWKDIVSYSTSDNGIWVYGTSSQYHERYYLFEIYAAPSNVEFYAEHGHIRDILGKTPSGANVCLEYSNNVSWLAMIDELRENIQSSPADREAYNASISLLTNGKITFDDIVENPDMYVGNTSVEDFIYQEIVPTVKFRN